METTGVIDRFLDLFARYIDSCFGLIRGDVGYLASTLIVIDVTLAFLFYAWGDGDDILARLVKKTLHVGFFAFLLSNWNGLAKIIYLSFSGLGLKAAGSGSADDLLHPGEIAQLGLDAGKPLLDQASALMGFTSFFANFVQITVLMLAWAIILIAFFIIAIQIFVTLLEFKLVTLAGFVLVPFGLFGRTAYLAERVLGNIISTGVKVLVLAIIIGIGTTIFRDFVIDFGSTPPTLEQVASVALASLTLLGLAIFGPGIANGIVSGGPQLGAGAAIGTGVAAAGLGVAAGAGLASAAGLAARGSSAGAAMLSRSAASPGGGSSGGVTAPLGPSGGAPSAPDGAPGGGSGGGAMAAPTAPAWAKRLRRQQAMTQGATMAAHSVRAADSGGGSTHISLAEEK
ncbi:MAG: trbL [Novosphingobium sp.]|nr:trbL [Novosphingobium sp.]